MKYLKFASLIGAILALLCTLLSFYYEYYFAGFGWFVSFIWASIIYSKARNHFKKYKKVTFKNYDKIVLQIEQMGDCNDYNKNKKLQKEFERLADMIRDFDKIHYPIERSNK